MTRRDVIKSGAGIAAILAAGRAPAALVKSMLGARMTIASGAKRLPYDAEVEYLESTGTQWIDTGVVPTLYSKSEIVARFSSVSSVQVCGAYWMSTNNAFDICGIANGNWFMRALTSGSPNPTGWTADTSKHTFIADAASHTMSVDGVSVTRSAIAIGNPTSVYLFSRHEQSLEASLTYPCLMQIFSVTFWDNGTLVRDFIPVRVGNVGYMYDRVSGKLFCNQGTGAFVIGPDKARFGLTS